MAKQRLNKYERETILLTSEGDDTWDIYTFNTDLKNRLRIFAAQYPDLCKLKEENKELGSVSYTIQKSRVSIRLIAPYSDARRKGRVSMRKSIAPSAKFSKENLLKRKIHDMMTVLKRGLLSGKWRYL